MNTFVNPSHLVRTVYLNWQRAGTVPFHPSAASVKAWAERGLYEPWLFENPDKFPPDADPIETCERLFMKYNRDDRPDGQQRRSMSTGDLVQIGSRTFLCGYAGWTEIL